MNRKIGAGQNTCTNKNQRTNARKHWKQDDLIVLEREFAKGTRLKVIARILNRTETSINKELSRSGIRLQKNTKTKQFVVINSASYRNKRFDDLTAIINYLRSKRYDITYSRQKLNEYGEVLCRLNNMPTSVARLLVIANKHRVEDGLPVFRVREPEN